MPDSTNWQADMRSADEREARRADAKNAVEEYVYEMRDKLAGPLEPYIAEQASIWYLFFV